MKSSAVSRLAGLRKTLHVISPESWHMLSWIGSPTESPLRTSTVPWGALPLMPTVSRNVFVCSNPLRVSRTLFVRHHSIRCYSQQPQQPSTGTVTPVPATDEARPKCRSPFYFEAGYALFAKRPSRPFPPPFLSVPTTSFSDPLSNHMRSRVNGEMIRGITNGDDAVLVSDYFIGANDGVGAWATREKGHAA